MGEIGVFVKSLTVFNRRVLIIRRSNYTIRGKGEWDIPGGGMQIGETILECLHREVKEETGLAIRDEKLVYAMTLLVSPTDQVIGLTYISHADSDKVILSHEHTNYIWATMAQLKERLTKATLDDYERHSVFDVLDID